MAVVVVVVCGVVVVRCRWAGRERSSEDSPVARLSMMLGGSSLAAS